MPEEHICTLSSIRKKSGIPKIAPNAPWTRKFFRNFQKLLVVNGNHFKCKKMFRHSLALLSEKKRHATGPYFYVIHPLSSLNLVLEITFFILWFYSLIALPAIEFVEIEYGEFLMSLQNKVVGMLQMVMVIIFFNIGYIHKKNNSVVLESKKIVCRYLKTYFIFDIVATSYLVILVLTYLHFIKKFHHRMDLKFIHIIRTLATAIRIPTLIRFMNDVLLNLRITKYIRSISCQAIKTYLVLHLFGFLAHKVPHTVYYGQEMPKDSWLYKSGLLGGPSVDAYRKYYEALVMVSAYFFGIDYSYDLTVPCEQICAVFVSFFGRLYTLYLLADILSVFGIASVSKSSYERHLSFMRNYLTKNNVPQQLQTRCIKCYEYKYQGRFFREDRILNSLSKLIRTEIFLFSVRQMIEKVNLFKHMHRSTLAAMFSILKTETFATGHTIIEAGSEINCIFFISAGTVAVLNDKGAELCHYEDGNEFGDSCLFLKKQKYEVVALETTEVVYVHKDQFVKFLRTFPDLMKMFYNSARDKVEKLKHLEDMAAKEVDLLSELQRGIILEKRNKKMDVVNL